MVTQVLAIGGPADGKVMGVDGRAFRFGVTVCNPRSLLAPPPPEFDRNDMVGFTTSHYEYQEVSFFGLRLGLFMHESLIGADDTTKAWAVARVLLTDDAQSVIQR